MPAVTCKDSKLKQKFRGLRIPIVDPDTESVFFISHDYVVTVDALRRAFGFSITP